MPAHSSSFCRNQRWSVVCTCWKDEERSFPLCVCMHPGLFRVHKQRQIIHVLLHPWSFRTLNKNLPVKAMKCPDKNIISHYILTSVFVFLYYYSCIIWLGKIKISCPSLSWNSEILTNMLNSERKWLHGQATRKCTSYHPTLKAKFTREKEKTCVGKGESEVKQLTTNCVLILHIRNQYPSSE